MAIHRCPPEPLLIAAHANMPCLVNAPMCSVVFTAVRYKRLRCKRRLERICAFLRTRLSGVALQPTSMPHLLRVGNLFLGHFTLTVRSCNRN